MLKLRKFRKITGFWLKMLVWLVVLVGVVLVQSGAFRPVEVDASINISATVNEPIIEKVLPATGPVAGNTGVTITGQNFEDVNAVTFGGVNALSFRVESPTLITAVTPPGKSGPVKVVVVTADKAISLDNSFTYVASPTATAVPSPTATVSPTNPAPTATIAADVTMPAATTPATTEIAGSPEAASPSPAVSPSPSPEATTPASSPAATIEPTNSPAVTPGTMTTGPTSPPATTAAPSASPTVNVTTPAATVTNPSPSPAVNPTPVLTPTQTPASSPTATIASPTAETPATVRVSPAVTPTATISISPTVTVTATLSVSPTVTVTAIPSVSPAVTGTPDTAVTVTPGTPATEEAPTATVVVVPTPTAIVAPTATPAASPSPSPAPEVSNPPTISQVSPATGPATGGTAVIIKGTNFTEDTQVTLGGLNPASVIVNGPTQLTVVTAPQPAGKISIVVKTGYGLASLADGFTYTSQPVEISQEPTNFNYSGKLTGKVLTLKSTFSVGIKDLSGSGTGWHLVARSTVLSSGNDVIPVANHTIQNVRIVTKSGTPPQNKVAYPLIFPTSDNTIFSAEPNTGTGESLITFETQLVIPPDIPAGNYKLTLNVAVEPGA